MENPMEGYGDSEFRRKFRFTKDTVINIIFPMVQGELKSYHGSQLPPILQLLVGLRFFATGAFQNVLGDTVQVSQPSVQRIVSKLSRILAGRRSTHIKFPNEAEAGTVRSQFYEIAKFPGNIFTVNINSIIICHT
jgi:hypothetical protein